MVAVLTLAGALVRSNDEARWTAADVAVICVHAQRRITALIEFSTEAFVDTCARLTRSLPTVATETMHIKL